MRSWRTSARTVSCPGRRDSPCTISFSCSSLSLRTRRRLRPENPRNDTCAWGGGGRGEVRHESPTDSGPALRQAQGGFSEGLRGGSPRTGGGLGDVVRLGPPRDSGPALRQAQDRLTTNGRAPTMVVARKPGRVGDAASTEDGTADAGMTVVRGIRLGLSGLRHRGYGAAPRVHWRR